MSSFGVLGENAPPASLELATTAPAALNCTDARFFGDFARDTNLACNYNCSALHMSTYRPLRVCVLHITVIPFLLPIGIQNTQRPCRLFILERYKLKRRILRERDIHRSWNPRLLPIRVLVLLYCLISHVFRLILESGGRTEIVRAAIVKKSQTQI